MGKSGGDNLTSATSMMSARRGENQETTARVRGFRIRGFQVPILGFRISPLLPNCPTTKKTAKSHFVVHQARLFAGFDGDCRGIHNAPSQLPCFEA